MAEPSRTRAAAKRARLNVETAEGHNGHLAQAGLGAVSFMGIPREVSKKIPQSSPFARKNERLSLLDVLCWQHDRRE